MNPPLDSDNNNIIQKGNEIFKKYDALGPTKCFQRITSDDIAACGGKNSFLQIFIEFYEKFMSDPVTSVLFDQSNPDSNVDATEHGTRLGLWYLARFGDDSEYMDRRGNLFQNFGRAHKRAMGCPRRPEEQQGRGFGVQHRDLWLGYQYEACRLLSIPEVVTSKLMGLGAGYGMGFIAVEDGI
mmetsp:Transcript_26474/g.44746  ORF Transcript_26474/g.44746 Transcript_26474/m.44746 type:complete len:183 (+) Transcript_26474:87-635(+)